MVYIGGNITVTFKNVSSFQTVEVICGNEQRLLSSGKSTTFEITQPTSGKVKVYNGTTLIREVGFSIGVTGTQQVWYIQNDGIKANIHPFSSENHSWSYVHG
jgi:hypothetical protein